MAIDSLNTHSAKEVVVTATRSEKELEDVALPVTVISKKRIEQQGAMRLSEVLEEQTGLVIMHDHGTGVQMQGFSPAYTLILIDGEPVIGRTAGTLELTRFTVANIERIEIVKGPSSSLFGSEALGGVINIITKQAEEPFKAKLNTRYGTFDAADLSAILEGSTGNLSASLIINRNSSSGYDLTPETESRTTPEFYNYTLNPKLCYKFSDATTLALAVRWLVESQRGIAQSGMRLVDSKESLLDWNASANFTHKFSPFVKTSLRLYGSRYDNRFTNTFRDDGSVFFSGAFDQRMLKIESQTDWVIGVSNILTIGAGYIDEGVAADRIAGGSRAMNTAYLYAQNEFIPFSWLNLTASFRFDRNSDFGSQLSPRIAALYKATEWLSIRASVGSGFKAPTFQQLYLDFTNAAAGYSVFGSTNVRESFRRLQEQGLIQGILLDPSQLEPIRAESSLAFNVGADMSPAKFLSFKINVFRNNVRDLIDTQPIAVRTGGGNIFTYFNLNRVFTEGIETELAVKLFPSLTLSAGYQFVNAKDEGVLEKIRAGRIGRTAGDVLNPVFVPITESQYGGLFGRSNHLLNVKLLYENEEMGLSAFLRGVIRSRYGFQDRNGNLILDDDSEYAPGYAIWDITINQKLWAGFSAQIGVDNIFNQTDPFYTPFLPGRIWFVGVRWESF
ncbi:MAG: TonB-dependent receptor [Chloroherpetonaceae bacterium]|nr:TonB-dependent receptor [Chloroherpetonaceae bacterium]MCS7210542.1 TonB-dependent receptor [Chloroherpetonaceae bacterium]